MRLRRRRTSGGHLKGNYILDSLRQSRLCGRWRDRSATAHGYGRLLEEVRRLWGRPLSQSPTSITVTSEAISGCGADTSQSTPAVFRLPVINFAESSCSVDAKQ